MFRLETIDLEIDPDIGEEGHIKVRYPHQRKETDDVAAPVLVEELVPREDEEQCGYVMAETIFTCKQVEELPRSKRPAVLTASNAVFARLPEDFFVGDRPRNGSDRNRQHKEPDYLGGERHLWFDAT